MPTLKFLPCNKPAGHRVAANARRTSRGTARQCPDSKSRTSGAVGIRTTSSLPNPSPMVLGVTEQSWERPPRQRELGPAPARSESPPEAPGAACRLEEWGAPPALPQDAHRTAGTATLPCLPACLPSSLPVLAPPRTGRSVRNHYADLSAFTSALHRLSHRVGKSYRWLTLNISVTKSALVS